MLKQLVDKPENYISNQILSNMKLL